jgi:predicted transglutaminase-like cysteine proteinase
MTARTSLSGFTCAAAFAAATAAAMLPATAQAAIETAAMKVANAKDFAIGDTCRTSAALTSTASAVVRPVAPETPSALDRMRMSQEQPVPVVEIAPASGNPVAVGAIAAGADRLFKPVRAVVAPPRVDCAAQVATMATRILDDDSELGTLAIPVDTTRFDDRWARVRRAPAARLMQMQLDRAAVSRGLGEAATLERVNLWVNRQIAYVDDDRNYRQRDFWAAADETVARGSGDCEDYAILKMHMLRAVGIADDRMKLVLLRDLAINADHAFLLVRSEAGWVVLDNMTDRVYDGRQANAVRPIMSFSGNQRWVHGYRDTAAPTVMAAAAAPKASATAFASAAPAASGRMSLKTAWVNARGVKLALAHVSIGNELPRMLGRLSPRGRK